MSYQAPLQDMIFVLRDLCDLTALSELPGLEDASIETVEAVLGEAAKFAAGVLGPLDRVGDLQGAKWEAGRVSVPEGWQEAYDQIVEMGWNSPSADPEHGGMGLPFAVNAAIQEMFNGANTAFQLCPLLTQGAIEAIAHYASADLQAVYLPRLVSGEWSGTMNLTEPQAGSDLAAIRSRAVPEGDHYRISGQKIFITYGEHGMTENIIHLVLARLPDAPEGVKGISLFVVPKFLPDAAGAPGAANDLRCVSIEHKLGIHGSPTCTMSFGDEGGAIGWLVGQPHHGLAYMFAMMNAARLNVGLQGIGIAEHAGQGAIAYAADRRQGGRPGAAGSVTIDRHPDVMRMLGLIAARTQAARVLAYRAAAAHDIATRARDAAVAAKAQRRLDLLIPVVKGWSTEMGNVSASLAVQVHGGMGFIEETGAAQHLRDARITTIYEGTTGIQALDLVGRKTARDKGLAMGELLEEIEATVARLATASGAGVNWGALRASLAAGLAALRAATDWILAAGNPDLPQASATPMLDLAGTVLGGWAMADAALAAAVRIGAGEDTPFLRAKLRIAEFYHAQIASLAPALSVQVIGGAEAVLALSPEDLAL